MCQWFAAPSANVPAAPPPSGEQQPCEDGTLPDPNTGLCANGLPPPSANVPAAPPPSGEQQPCEDGTLPDPNTGLCANGLPPPSANVTARSSSFG